MKKYILSVIAVLSLAIALVFSSALVKADDTNKSAEQFPAPKVSEVTFNGEAVEPIVTSVADSATATTPQATALKNAKNELEGATKDSKNDKGETVQYVDYAKIDQNLDKALDDLAKKENKDYNSSVFTVQSLFEFSLPEGKVASPESPVVATFDAGTSSPVTVIHKVDDKWVVVDASDVTQTGTSVKVKFTKLCPVAFLTVNPNALVNTQQDLSWMIFVAIGVILLVVLLIVIFHKPKDKVANDNKEPEQEPQEEETSAEEEQPAEEETPVEEEQTEETQEEPQEETPAEEEQAEEETSAEEPQEETQEEQAEEETPAEEPQEETQEEPADEEQPAEEEAPVEEEQTEETQEEPQEEETPAEEEAPTEEEAPVEEEQPAEEETPAEEEAAPEEETPAETEESADAPVVVPVADGEEEKQSKPGKYEIYPVGKGEFFIYRLKASNGEIMVISELYRSAQGAQDAINTVLKNLESGIFDIYQDKHNMWQFKLYSSNKRLLVASANYRTKARCESACESFKRLAPISPVVKLDEDVNHLMEEIELDPGEDKKGGKIIVDKDNGESESEFRLLANNGTVLCSSMSYKTRSILMEQANNFYKVVTEGKFYVVKDKNKMYQFKLYSGSGRCILIGETYGSKNNAISAANSVARFAKLAEVIIEE